MQVLIVLLDRPNPDWIRQNDDFSYLVEAADQLYSTTMIKTIAIGIGDQVNKTNLDVIANNITRNVFNVSSVNELELITNEVLSRSCDGK